MKGKKNLIIAIIIIAVIIIAVSLFLAFRDISERNKLTVQINALSEENTNTDVTLKGVYGIIEKMVKEDYKLYIDSTNTLRDNYNEIAQLKALNIENYKNDGPDFTNSLEKLNSIKAENEENMQKLLDLVDEAKIEEKTDGNGLKGRHKKLYKEILEQLELSNCVNEVKETDTKFATYLNSLIDVLNYMKDNKSEWFIENDTLKSKSQEFIDNYNAKVEETEKNI